MKPLNSEIIEYFIKNEDQLMDNFGLNPIKHYENYDLLNSFARTGYTVYSFLSLSGPIPFSVADFKMWQNHKEYYSSGLYKALNE
jgi:hypothetical protein